VLGRRHLESYLMDAEVIDALCASVGQPQMASDAMLCLQNAIDASVAQGNDRDDLKSAAGTFYVCLRKLLRLESAGSTTEAFLAGTLAPLLKPGMKTFADLRSAVFDLLFSNHSWLPSLATSSTATAWCAVCCTTTDDDLEPRRGVVAGRRAVRT
jgi:hypothetical protein